MSSTTQHEAAHAGAADDVACNAWACVFSSSPLLRPGMCTQKLGKWMVRNEINHRAAGTSLRECAAGNSRTWMGSAELSEAEHILVHSVIVDANTTSAFEAAVAAAQPTSARLRAGDARALTLPREPSRDSHGVGPVAALGRLRLHERSEEDKLAWVAAARLEALLGSCRLSLASLRPVYCI